MLLVSRVDIDYTRIEDVIMAFVDRYASPCAVMTPRRSSRTAAHVWTQRRSEDPRQCARNPGPLPTLQR